MKILSDSAFILAVALLIPVAPAHAYLDAASHVLGGQPSFTYVRELIDGDQAMLEFNLEIDGIHIDGVDIIRWNTDGLIVDFKVMVRPLKALNLIWVKMGAQLTRG